MKQSQVKHYEYHDRVSFLAAKKELDLVPATVYHTLGPHWCDIYYACNGVSKRPYKKRGQQ